jgi:hypothetical protein
LSSESDGTESEETGWPSEKGYDLGGGGGGGGEEEEYEESECESE